MTERIPICRPSFDEQEFEAVRATLQSGWVGRGPRTVEFERAFADYIGGEHAVAVNSATAALHAAGSVTELTEAVVRGELHPVRARVPAERRNGLLQMRVAAVQGRSGRVMWGVVVIC